MAKEATAVQRILDAIEPWLNAKMEEWLAQGGEEEDRTPTLPVTKENKVNVTKLVKDLALQLKAGDAQHFYKPEIAAVVNAVAEQQGIKGIGSTAKEDDAAKNQIRRTSSENRKLGQALSQTSAEVLRLREELELLRTRMSEVQSSGWLVRDKPVKDDVCWLLGGKTQ